MKTGINIPERLWFFKKLGSEDGKKRHSLGKREALERASRDVLANAPAHRPWDALKTPKRFERIPTAFDMKVAYSTTSFGTSLIG